MGTNCGAHTLDVTQLIHNTERTAPVSGEGEGQYPAPGTGRWNVLLNFQAQYRCADGVVVDYPRAVVAFQSIGMQPMRSRRVDAALPGRPCFLHALRRQKCGKVIAHYDWTK